MSDYGDDFSDYGEDWFYVEEEYMVADDLAEHAVNSPPPTTYADEDALPDWDRFDYFNDLEYASDGYDDATFYPHNSKTATTGQKRKREPTGDRGGKRRKLAEGRTLAPPHSPNPSWPPVIWRSQGDREPKPKLLKDNVEPYALLKDWRERLADTPAWASGSPHPASPSPKSPDPGTQEVAFVSEPISPAPESEAGEEEDEEGDTEIDPTILMQVLQSRLAAAGGPLNGMDPQQLLQFAIRMVTDKDAGDDIAGEMADEMLNQGEDEDEEGGEASLLSWISQQRNTNQQPSAGRESAARATSGLQSPEATPNRPPTPLSSNANRSVHAADQIVRATQPNAKNAAAFKQNTEPFETTLGSSSRKRKAEDTDSSDTMNTSKRRAARSCDAPAAASQTKAVPTKVTRSESAKRS